MAGRHGKKKALNATAGLGLLGAGASVFIAAAALATGSAVTAAPARADIDALIDPIIQPIVSSFADSLAVFDPAAALDLTSWTDSFLASLNTSFDFLLPSVAEPAASTALATSDVASTSYDLPLGLTLGTEPTIQAAIGAGDPSTLLVDTGSGGLVIPWQELGSNDFNALGELFKLGPPDNYGISGYSGGVEYFYLTYDGVPVDYGTDGTDVLSTSSPVDVELFSWSTNPNNIFENFQSFLGNNNVDGILGIGQNTAGPTTTPFADYEGVLVNIPGHQLVIGPDPLTHYASTDGAPISQVSESVGSGTPMSLYNNIDSGGVNGTIPSSLIGGSGVAPDGTVISVHNADGDLLYRYTVGDYDISGPTISSGIGTSVSNSIDSGVIPFLQHPIYLDYGTHTTYFDNLPN